MADNQPQDYVPRSLRRSFLWKHLIIEGNQIKCRYCQSKWDLALHGPATSTIRVHMVKYHLQEIEDDLKMQLQQ